MIVTKITLKLLQGLAIQLARYANTIEKYLAEKNFADGQFVAIKSPDEPPAHWLEKVRQGAPHLLDQTVHEIGHNPFFYMANDHQGLQLNSPTLNEQQSEFNNNSINKPPNQYLSKNIFETIKKYIYHSTLGKMRPAKDVANQVNLSDEELIAKNSPNEPPAHWLEKVRQGAPHLLDQTDREIGYNPTNDYQGINLNSSALSKQQSEIHHNSVSKPSTPHSSKNLLETFKKYIYLPTLVRLKHTKKVEDNKVYLSDEELVAKNSFDEPPAHWLAKVRQGAPDLIDQIEHKIGYSPIFNMANDHQDRQLNSSPINQQRPEFNNNSSNEPSTQYISKSIVETIKKYIYPTTLKKIRHANKSAKNKLNLSDEELIAKNSSDEPPAHWLAKVRQGAPDLLDQTPQLSAKQTSNNLREKIKTYAYLPALALVKQSKITGLNSQLLKQKPGKETKRNFINSFNTKSEFTTPVKTASNLKKTAPPLQKMDEGADFKNTSRSQNFSDAGINLTVKKSEKRETLHLYQKTQTPASPAKTTQHNLEKKPASEGIKPIFLSVASKPNTPDFLHQKETLLAGNNRLKENPFKLPIRNNNPITNVSDALFLNLTSKHIKQQQKSASDKFQYGSTQWPSLPDETVASNNQDRWPQLPKKEWSQSLAGENNSLKRWQLQEQTNRIFLSEQEQRGKFWNE